MKSSGKSPMVVRPGLDYYLINLQSRPDRLAAAQRMFQSLDTGFHRIEAIDASSLDEANPFLSMPAEACFQSHMEAIRKIAAAPNNFGIIVEDDFQITNLKALHRQLDAVFDINFDVLQIGWLNNMLLDKILIKLQDWEGDFCHALYLASKKNNYLKKKVGHRLRVVRNGSEYRRDFVTDNFKSGCHFYVVSKNFAKLISASNIEPIMPIDNLFATLSASRKFRILRTRKSYVTQSDSVSSIKV